MKGKTITILHKLLKNAIGAAEDNVRRAEATFRNRTPEQMQELYGHSAETCQKVLDGYRRELADLQDAKKELEALL